MSLSFICLASLFFLHPCLSTSCMPLLKQYELPCNKSIEIKPPFFLINDTKNICESAINIKCLNENRSRVYPFHTANNWFSLENILYSTNKLIVSDPTLENEINSSSCGNLLFSFLTPQQFDFDLFSSFSTSIKSFCGSPNLSSQSPIFDEEYTLNYSATTNKYLPSNCSRKAPEASFEWKFSFDDDGSMFLLSAQYSYKFLSQQGCFNQSILGGNYNDSSTNTGKTNRATRKNILIVKNICESATNIKCLNENRSLVYPFHTANYLFSLKNILYSTNKFDFDPILENEINSSSCGNLLFSFLTPQQFDFDLFWSFSTNIKSFCGSPNLFSQSPIFGGEYTLNYSATTNNYLPMYCYRKAPNASLEWKFSFDDHGILNLLSAKYSYNILSQQGCFSQSIVGGNYQGTVTGSLAFIVACLLLFLKLRSGKNWTECILWSKDRPQENIEMLLEKYGFAPKRYKYAEVKKITCSFQDTLGKGGFGTVYKGRLQDGCLVAVKILHSPSSDREELLNEILSIAKTSHVNVVSLLGFCIEGSKHALIYEYTPNGSLDNYIYSENPKALLGWAKLYEIAIGIARGLEYLHRGCNTRIVHFDIKPQNILLDEDFNPKIADFGLAKLCPPKESIISMAEMRGTIGYIAPEVFSRSFGVVSTKSDVYSYGMMMLEMVGGRRNAKPSAENPSQVYFPHWLYNRLVEGSPIQACDVLSIETEEIARKMGMVGLWCTQTTPSNRPSMNRVIEMLEKNLDELEMPPKPYLCSPPHSTILSDTSHTPMFGLNSESDFDCLVGANTL